MFFVGKNLRDAKMLTEALERDIQPDHRPPDATPEYRKALTQGLLYKVQLIFELIFISSQLKSKPSGGARNSWKYY